MSARAEDIARLEALDQIRHREALSAELEKLGDTLAEMRTRTTDAGECVECGHLDKPVTEEMDVLYNEAVASIWAIAVLLGEEP